MPPSNIFKSLGLTPELAVIADAESRTVASESESSGGFSLNPDVSVLGNSGTIDVATSSTWALKAGHDYTLADGPEDADAELYLSLFSNGTSSATGGISFKNGAIQQEGWDDPQLTLVAAGNAGAFAYLRWSQANTRWNIIWTLAPGGSVTWASGEPSS